MRLNEQLKMNEEGLLTGKSQVFTIILEAGNSIKIPFIRSYSRLLNNILATIINYIVANFIDIPKEEGNYVSFNSS